MPDLSGGSERVGLGGGFALMAPGLRGRAELLPGGGAGTRAREASTPLLDDVLGRVEMTGVATVEIAATPVPGAPGAADLRDPRGDDALLLEVPDLGPGAGQVVLSVDEAGALTWHFPLENGEIQPPAVRGDGDRKRFLIRRFVPSVPPGADGRDRSLVGAVGRKLLKVLVYPISDALIGRPASALAEHWESVHRAYGLRDFSPANYRVGADGDAERERLALGGDDLRRLASGRSLLFVHGTFSTAHGAFADLPLTVMEELHRRYDGRVFAFDHFTLSHDPERNVRWLAQRMNALESRARLEVDVVCHSRGGLVARTLEVALDAFGIDVPLRVRRVAFVGVPNQGTLLAQPDHMVEMIDRLTTALNLLPPGGVADALEGILIAVKVIGHGALKGLAGLQSMDPDGDFLKRLNATGRADADYFAVAADYEPADAGLRGLVRRGVDALVDRIFEKSENDLVVPEAGVYGRTGGEGFPIPAQRCLRIPGSAGVMHTGMFGHPDVARSLQEWLR